MTLGAFPIPVSFQDGEPSENLAGQVDQFRHGDSNFNMGLEHMSTISPSELVFAQIDRRESPAGK